MADKRVDQLTDIDALADADSFPVRDASATTELKEVTASQIATYMASELAGTFQPLDSDLTAIAALSTTAYGRALLALADLAALRAVIGPTGTPSASTFLRGDGQWATPAGGGGGDLLAANNLSDVASAATALSNLGGQPLDSDLTAIAALATTAFGRGLLSLADAAAARTALELGNAATLTVDADIATLSLPASTTISAFGATLVDDADASAARTTLGLGNAATLTVDADLATFAVPASTTISAFGATLVDDADAATARTTLGLGNAATLTVDADIATLALPASTTISAFGATLVDDADASAGRTTLGLGTIATQAASAVAITGGTIENIGAVEYNVNTVATTGATETLDVSAANVHDCTMDQNCTFTFSNPAASGDCTVFALILRGAFTPTFPASVDWSGGAPTYATPSEYSFVTVDGGTTWLGVLVGSGFA